MDASDVVNQNMASQDSQQQSPLQAARSAVRHLNCSLDSLRNNVVRMLPRQRSLLGLPAPSEVRALHSHGRRPVSFSGSHFAAAIPGDTVVEQVFTSGINSFLNLYNTALLGRIILTWFPSAPAAIVTPLATVCDPYLNLFRGIIPPLGGTLDLSPILAFVALDLFTNAAAALPCEEEGQFRERRFQLLNPSQAAVAFRRRLAAQRRRRQMRSEA